MLTQFTTNTVVQHEETTHDDDGLSEYTDAMIYGYGTAAVAIITLLSLLGISLFPSLGSKSYKLTLQFFIGLGIGTMTADALLHIIPAVLGIHDHEVHEDEEEDDTIYVWKMSVVFGGIYLFYVLENGLKTWKRRRDAIKGTPLSTRRIRYSPENSTSGAVCDIDEELDDQSSKQDSVQELTGDGENHDIICLNFTTTVLTVFVGDTLHNIADGFAIGVSFAGSWTTGVGTSLAVLCHEVPHEFGDFAIYLNNGASKWRAVGLNVVAACCAFVGLYCGIALGHDESLRSWLLAVIAGMFLYIALVQVMTEMMREETSKPILQFVIQNFGLLLGWTIMLLIGLYEDDIETSITG